MVYEMIEYWFKYIGNIVIAGDGGALKNLKLNYPRSLMNTLFCFPVGLLV